MKNLNFILLAAVTLTTLSLLADQGHTPCRALKAELNLTNKRLKNLEQGKVKESAHAKKAEITATKGNVKVLQRAVKRDCNK